MGLSFLNPPVAVAQASGTWSLTTTSDAAETGSATNGQQTFYPPKTTFPISSGSSQSWTYGGQGVGIGTGTGPGASCSASASISLTFTGTWQGPGPAPSAVYLLETSRALYHGYAHDGSTSSQNSPSAADGFGDPAIPADPSPASPWAPR